MLGFTERAGNILRLLLEVVSFPGGGVRITKNRLSSAKRHSPPFEIAITSKFDVSDELVLASGGIPVFIDPEVVPLIRGAFLDGTLNEAGRPHFFLRRDEALAG